MMNITVKGPQEAFKIDIEPGQTVADLKAAINKSKGYTPGDQKLLYSGRPLKDDQLFGKIDFDEEKDFIVLLTSKPKKAKNTPLPATAEPSVECTPEVLSFVASPRANESESGEAKPDAHAGSENENLAPNTSRPKASVDVITPMPSSTQVASQSEQELPVAQSTHAPNSATPERTRDIDHVRRVIREDPTFRQYFIQSMRQQNPALAEQFTRNPGFLDSLLLMASNRPESEIPAGLLDRLKRVVEVDEEAIWRLVELGVSEAQAREAYLLSDKDEELAVGYLLASGAGRTSDHGSATVGVASLSTAQENPSYQTMVQSATERDPALGQLISHDPTIFEQASLNTSVEAALTPEDCEVIKSLVDLGFTAEQAVEAYLVCDKNEELAVDYLLDLSVETPSAQVTSAAASQLSGQSGSSPSHVVQSGRVPVAPHQIPATIQPWALSQVPATRQLVRESSSYRQRLTQSIVQRNPVLGPMINENRDLFDRMLRDVCAEDGNPVLSLDSLESAGGASGALMDRDLEAVGRLLDLGFSQQRAVEAYLVCDKNEQVALDYLLDQ